MTGINYRKERIERLLDELRYEITRGMMEGDVEEQLVFGFYVPVSKVMREGVVWCEFRTRPVHRGMMNPQEKPKLTVVK